MEGNIIRTISDALDRCGKATLENELGTEELLKEKEFFEHVWTKELEVDGRKIFHEYAIISKRSGIVRLEMKALGAGIEPKAILLAKFHFNYLSRNAIASAMAAIIENS